MQTDFVVRADDLLTIAEMARRYDISFRTLRFYEQQGLLKPERVGQQRLYAAKDRVRLEIILTGKRLRFSLREIDAMISSYTRKEEVEPTRLAVVLDRETIRLQLALLLRQKEEVEETISELKTSLEQP